ncbi:MAG: hypothetical protein LBR65_00610, partial [Culturomica sp.]|nr:hypothetical protein [Culturomica sp.]
RLASEVNKLTVDYQLRMNRQNSIARAISSLSVINLANNLMAEFSGTGTTEAENFLNRARQFQEQVHTEIYAKHVVQEYNSGNGNAITIEPAEGFDAKSAKIPVMESYQYVPLKDVFTDNLPDILLIAAWCGLFFTGAFISFIRFDVR